MFGIQLLYLTNHFIALFIAKEHWRIQLLFVPGKALYQYQKQWRAAGIGVAFSQTLVIFDEFQMPYWISPTIVTALLSNNFLL